MNYYILGQGIIEYSIYTTPKISGDETHEKYRNINHIDEINVPTINVGISFLEEERQSSNVNLRDVILWQTGCPVMIKRVVSKRFLEILKEYRCANFFSYELNVRANGQSNEYYLIVPELTKFRGGNNLLNYGLLEYVFRKKFGDKKIIEGGIRFKDVQDARENSFKYVMDPRKGELAISGTAYIKEDLDFFILYSTFFISERLKERIEEEGLLVDALDFMNMTTIPFDKIEYAPIKEI